MVDPFLALPGAVADASSGAASHFGAPLIEQRAFAEGSAAVSLSHRGIVVVDGPDRLRWLDSMTSQRLHDLAPGESTETLLLDPQGHIEHAIRITDDGERSWLLVDEGEAESLCAFLQRMRFTLRVEVHDLSDTHAAVCVSEGGSAVAALRGLGRASIEWQDPWSSTLGGGAQYARGNHPGSDWHMVQMVFERSDLPAIADLVAAGALRAAGTSSLDALEIRAWRPSFHGEVDERALPHEFDWLRTAVHLNKGCYRGQETVAKVHNLGHPPRRLVLLHLDGSGGELPTAGTRVFRAEDAGSADAKPVGRITRAALHYEWGGIALALLKRAVPEDAEFVVTGPTGEQIAASQEVIVPSDAGRTREVPRLPRL